MKNPKYCTLIIALLMFGFGEVVAQHFNNFRLIDELTPREQVKDVLKDELGFLWVATDQGLHRFDGINARFYTVQLGNSFTKDLFLRANGNVLVAHDSGITEIESRPDTVIFRSLQVVGQDLPDTLGYPKSIFEDQKGVLWVGENSSIIRIDKAGAQRIHLGHEATFGNYSRAFSIVEDAFGEVWAVSFFGSFYRWNRQLSDFEQVPLPFALRNCSAIQVLSGDNLLIGSRDGLLSLKVDSDGHVSSWDFFEEIQNVSSIAVVDESKVYVGTWDRGLYHAEGRQPSLLTWERQSDTEINDIVNLHAHSDSELWIVGIEQVGYLFRSSFQALSSKTFSRSESMTTDGHHAFYISKGHTIDRLDDKGVTTVLEAGEKRYAATIHWYDNKLWVGGGDGSIGFYNMASSEYTSIIDSQASIKIHSIYEDSKGNMWFAGREDGLVKVLPDLRFERYPEVAKSIVVLEASDGAIWSGGAGVDYLMRLAPEEQHFSPYALKLDFPINGSFRINDFAVDSKGVLWIATSLGLLKMTDMSSGAASRVKLQRIAVDEAVKAVTVDENARIWASTSVGLVRCDGDHTVIYDKENGLPSNILRERELLVHEDRIYVATARGTGIAHIDPAFERQTPTPVFSNIRLNGRRVSIHQGSIGSLYSNAEIRVEFLTLDYPGKDVYYQYRVAGVDKDWSEPELNRSLSFFGFRPGEYTLEVRAQKSSGYLWSSSNLLSFTVLPPWYRTWWAYILFVLLVGGLGLGGVLIYTDSLKRSNRKLERLVQERTREISQQQGEIVNQKNEIIRQKQEIIDKNDSVFEAQQALAKAELNYQQLRQKQLEEELEFRNKQLATHTLKLIQKNESFSNLKSQLEQLAKQKNGSMTDLKKSLKIIDNSFRLEKDWEEFQLYFEQIYTGFYAKLKINYPALTNQELRHCALIRLNMSIVECASLLGISPDSVKVSRARLKKKLDLSSNQSVMDFILAL